METVNKLNNCKVSIELTSVTPHEYKSRGNGITIGYGFADTPFGECFVGGSENGICMLQFCIENRDELIGILRNEWKNADFREDYSIAEETVDKLFSTNFSGSPIRLWLKGTPFQFKVWKTLLMKISCGRIVTYKELAQLSGYPTAIRAVASAVAQNPVGYIIPCHRVVRSDGTIGQYHWGSERKKAILEWEK